MHRTSQGLLHAATDLSNHLSCAHLTALNRAVAMGEIGKPRVFEDPAGEVLRQRGLEHEAAFLEDLRAKGLWVVEVPDADRADVPADGAADARVERWTRRAADTLEAMRAGADVIYQGCLFDGAWVGLPDFLQRVDTASGLGGWSYEVVDAKLARDAKAGAVLQIALYSDLLERAQGAAPEEMGIALGGPDARVERFRVADFAAYYRSVRGRYEASMGIGAPGATSAARDPHGTAAGSDADPALPYAPDPVAFCQLCRWKLRCDEERRDVDHLALVAGISRGQRRALHAIDITTMAGLGALPIPRSAGLDGVSDAALQRIREQARLQVEGRERGAHLHELLTPVVAGQGLAALPEPSPGDLFFDIEADPYAFQHGIEYLFGYCDDAGEFTAIWALDPRAEKAAFERFVDLVVERRERWPALHVYHFGHYETTALKRLMGRHGTREDEIDGLLRGKVFVDLHRVVKQGLRASVESYSIKRLEPFYGFEREVELRDANSALGHFEAWLQMGGGRRAVAATDGPRDRSPGGDHEGEDPLYRPDRADEDRRGPARPVRGAMEAAERDLLDRIEGYNRDDCVSTLRLREWLESLRLELGAATGEPVPRPDPESDEPPESVAEEVEAVAELVRALTDDVSAETPGMADGDAPATGMADGDVSAETPGMADGDAPTTGMADGDVSAETPGMGDGDVSAETPAAAAERHARWLLAQLLGFHRREAKSTWWRYFTRRDFSEDELVEDRATLGRLDYVGEAGRVKRSTIHRYRFPRQDHDIGLGGGHRDPATNKTAGTVVAVDDLAGTIDIKRGDRSDKPHPRALVPLDHVTDDVLKESLREVARAVIAHELEGNHPFGAAVELLRRRPPRLGGPPGAAGARGPGDDRAAGGGDRAGASDLAHPDETALEAARRLAPRLDRTVLPIQGPPGAGKTYTAARMIVTLLAAGKRVGVTANSHKVITNLLDGVCKAADEEGVAIAGIQKSDGDSGCGDARIEVKDDNAAMLEALASGDVRLGAGTAWLWARPDMQRSVDVLFVDEAGQFSLANAVAVSRAADSLVLVGDPAQLEQPTQGVHPPGAGVAAMDHLLGDDATFPPERGLFLEHTWRLHPDICGFTSEIFYRGRLRSRAGLENQRVDGPEPLNGSGLRFVPVEHAGNTSESEEEVDAVRRIVEAALGGGSPREAGESDAATGPRTTWTDLGGESQVLTLDDILVVAPYNLQVAALKQALPPGARVGTVDKFQGQQAPVVIYSMASSSAEDAPRGMGFLYSPNRLNVATSRAKCLAIVVGSPDIFVPECRSPEQMRLANAFCRFRELAT